MISIRISSLPIVLTGILCSHSRLFMQRTALNR